MPRQIPWIQYIYSMTSNPGRFLRKIFAIARYLLRWTALLMPMALITGSLVALFLGLLGAAIHFRFHHQWLLFLLPGAGLLIHLIYQTVGRSSEKGNNLIIEQINLQGGDIPARMAPVILLTTVITHLFGGSAGREGTAVQIGGSIAALFGRWFKLSGSDVQTMLTAGVAAGFGAVFGTPLTGAVFALEVLSIGRIRYQALLPALLAAIAGDMTVAAWKVTHTPYHIDPLPPGPHLFSAYPDVDLLLVAKVMVSATAFGLASYFFSKLAEGIKHYGLHLFKSKWMIPVFGGSVIIFLTFILGKPDYLSLGIEAEYSGAVTIPSAFHSGGADSWSWLWKSIFTAVTLGTGFKGGEVTPLFYIGATLGNICSVLLHAPVSLFAALGFIAVFAGSTNTPLACTLMGIELFGAEHAMLFALACFIAYLCSGKTGIYSAQLSAITPDGQHKRGYLHYKLNRYFPHVPKGSQTAPTPERPPERPEG